MKNFIYRCLGLFLTVVMLVGMSGCTGSRKEIVIFSSMENYRNLELSRLLAKEYPEITVTVQQISTGNSTAKIKEEGSSTEADIVLGLETASYEKIIDNFAPLDSFQPKQYLPEFIRTDNRGWIWEKFEGSIIVNTIELEKRNLPEPKNYQDLLDPIYRNLIVMSNPKTSGTGYMFLNSWVRMMGEEKAFQYVDELQKNIKQFSESGAGPVQLLNQGEAVIGLGMVFQAAQQISEGSPLKIIIPEEGGAYNTTLYGIIKGRETDPDIVKVFNYLTEEFLTYDKENFSPGQVTKEHKVRLPGYPEKVKSADMSTITNMELKKQLLDKWKY